MPSKAMTTPAASEDAIRTRAYLLWEADGRPFGRDEHYWGLAYTEVITLAARPRSAAATAKAPEKKAKVAAKPAKTKAPAPKAAKPPAKTAAKSKKK